MLDHSLDDSECGPTIAPVPAHDWSHGIAEIRDLQESSSRRACTTHVSTESSPLFAPTLRNFLVSPSFASSTHNSDDMYTGKGRARDVHNRGGALFCLLFLPRDSCKLGLCNSHRELRGQMTTDKRMQELYLLNDRHVPGHATAQDRGGRMENLDRALTAMGSRATGCAAWGCHITLPTAMSTRR